MTLANPKFAVGPKISATNGIGEKMSKFEKNRIAHVKPNRMKSKRTQVEIILLALAKAHSCLIGKSGIRIMVCANTNAPNEFSIACTQFAATHLICAIT